MLYIVTTFLSAFLLFMIQPLMGKLVLPWFGGAPSVWTTCMLFFQVALLGGYGYAHVLSTRLPPRIQARLHAALIATAVVVMVILFRQWGSPILPGEEWKPEGGETPVPHIMLLLLASIGLPYFLLSATSPLLQRWYSLGTHGANPWRLYAVSNAGSLLGLVSYPFLAERFLTLPAQAVVWSTVFVLFAAGAMLVAARIWRTAGDPADPEADEPSTGERRGARPTLAAIIIWLLLTICTSAMLLAVTNQLCQEVAAVPFLWVLPLSLYLLSFIICFDRPAWYRRRLFVAVTAVLTVVVLITTFLGLRLSIPVHILSFSSFLFFFCMTCHGELVGMKPSTSHLTLFYLVVAAGGALGGVFVALVAPIIFTSYWEFNVMTAMAWVVLAIVFSRDRNSFFFAGDRWHFHLLTWFLLYCAIRVVILTTPPIWQWPEFALSLPASAALAFLLALLPALLLRGRRFPAWRIWPRVLVGLIVLLAELFMIVQLRRANSRSLVTDRNFYGTLRVQSIAPRGNQPQMLFLTHGQIVHGIQYQDERFRNMPVSYYGEPGGLSTAVRFHPRRQSQGEHKARPLRIGVLGLGAGTIAAFAEPGDRVRFYEINPTVARLAAGDDPLFTYLKDSKGDCEVVLGDARLSLERELRSGTPQKFDILVMDAFSSDSIPVHLLTREAFEIYRKHLRDNDSIIAVNISNRFLDLRDLTATAAEDLGFTPLLIANEKNTIGASPSLWMLLTQSRGFRANPEVLRRSSRWHPRHAARWTDSFSNLMHLLI